MNLTITGTWMIMYSRKARMKVGIDYEITQ